MYASCNRLVSTLQCEMCGSRLNLPEITMLGKIPGAIEQSRPELFTLPRGIHGNRPSTQHIARPALRSPLHTHDWDEPWNIGIMAFKFSRDSPWVFLILSHKIRHINPTPLEPRIWLMWSSTPYNACIISIWAKDFI